VLKVLRWEFVFLFFKKRQVQNLFFLYLAFDCWSSMCNFVFRAWAASNVIYQRFGDHCSCHSRGKCVIVGRILSALYIAVTYCLSFSIVRNVMLTQEGRWESKNPCWVLYIRLPVLETIVSQKLTNVSLLAHTHSAATIRGPQSVNILLLWKLKFHLLSDRPKYVWNFQMRKALL
jgi:hypothetical protein